MSYLFQNISFLEAQYISSDIQNIQKIIFQNILLLFIIFQLDMIKVTTLLKIPLKIMGDDTSCNLLSIVVSFN